MLSLFSRSPERRRAGAADPVDELVAVAEPVAGALVVGLATLVTGLPTRSVAVLHPTVSRTVTATAARSARRGLTSPV
jgi:hypothetical protein